MELLDKLFSELNGGNADSMIEEQKMIVSTNIDTQGPNKKDNKKQTKESKKPPPNDPSTICEFCDRIDKGFKD